MKRNFLSLGIIFLFIISSISPMVFGNNNTVTEEDKLLDNLAFMCYNEYGSSKYEYLKEHLKNDYPDSDMVESEEIITPVETESTIMPSGGPMDSPWSMQCYNNRHTSQSPYSTADNPYDEIWRFKCNSVEGGPIIDSNGIIYFGDFDGFLFALYPDGTLKWKYKMDWVWSVPAIDEEGTIYVGSWDDYLYAIYPDGTLKWRFLAHSDITSSPAISDEGIIYFGVMGPSNNGRVYAVYPNGTEKWHYDTGYWTISDPAIDNNGMIYIGSGDTYLYAFYPNGTLHWRFKTGDYIKGPPSIAEDGTIYIGSFDDYLYALFPNNGTMKWKCKVGLGTETNPSIASDGTIYVGSYDGKLYAVYPNGTLKWKFSVQGNIHQSSPAISADGTIYFGTDDAGYVYAVNPDGTERWSKKIATNWVESSPAIDEDGTIYIGSSSDEGGMSYGYLHAFSRAELKAEANGLYYGLKDEPVQFSGSATGGYPPYSYHWDFGDTYTSDEQNPTHTYTSSGNYTVTLTVTDDSSNTSEDTTWAWIQDGNSPPDTPEIDGPVHGTAGKSYPYNFITTDSWGLPVWYYIDWDDGSNTGWIGPYSSGITVTKNHKWSNEGTYTIRCKAKDPYDDESSYGELQVTMPRDKSISYSLLQRWIERFPLLNYLFQRLTIL